MSSTLIFKNNLYGFQMFIVFFLTRKFTFLENSSYFKHTNHKSNTKITHLYSNKLFFDYIKYFFLSFFDYVFL